MPVFPPRNKDVASSVSRKQNLFYEVLFSSKAGKHNIHCLKFLKNGWGQGLFPTEVSTKNNVESNMYILL